MNKTKKPIALFLSLVMALTMLPMAASVLTAGAADAGNTDAYSLTYNANGGSGADITQTAYNRQAVQLNANPFTKTGYHMTGWNTEANGSGVAYPAGASVTNPAVSYRARYIRVYAAGNTYNDADGYYMANHLSELQVIDAQGNNVALGRSGDVVTDGNIATTSGCYKTYGDYNGTPNYYQIDLGAQYDIKTVNMWRYWEFGTKYHNTVVVLSENGTFAAGDRFVLFNADYTNRFGFGNGIDMEYYEGANGLSMSVSDVRRSNTYEARYIRVYAAGNNENDAGGAYMANHLVELVVNDASGNNVALNRTGNYVTNGTVDTNQYFVYGDYNGTGNYYQVDFGGVYDIASIGMWRYWADARIYYDTIVVLSRNGTFAEGDRFVVFNADDTGRFGFGKGTDKDYRETARGKALYVENEAQTLPSFNARYVRIYAAGNDQNDAGGAYMANHIVELKAMWGATNVAYGRTGNAATDGVVDTNYYIGFGGYFGTANYYQIDFGAVYPVNSVSYWGYWADARVNHNLIIALSRNGTFTGDDLCVLWNADSSNMFGFGRGTDPAYAETSAGRTFTVPAAADDPNTVTARYIRVYDYGNDENDIAGYPRCNQVAELAAYTANGVNVATGGSAQDASIIDGNISYGVYYAYGTGYGRENNYFWVDLGQEYALAKIRLWRYWVDNRTFHTQVIALSKNGTFSGDDLTVIWNTDKNNVHGLGAGTDAAYAETAAGHEFTMPAGSAAPAARARYVRVYTGGNYANDAAGPSQTYAGHLAEIQVYAGSSVNVAYGKTGNAATDGSTNCSAYFGYGAHHGQPNYAQVDLGSVYNVTSVKLWQYYSDARTYHNTVVVLSENGTFAGNDYTVIFNSDYCNMHGFGRGFDNEYPESASGREFKAVNVYAPSSGTKMLYVQWAPNAYTVAFDGNGSDGGTVPASFGATYDSAFDLPTAVPTKTNYTFRGWTLSPDGGTVYTPGQNVSNLTSTAGATATLYAKWELNTYAVTFSADGTGYTNTAPAATVTHGGSVSFDVTLSDGYTNSGNPSVTATNGSVSSTKSGNTITYTVSNITGATTITVGAATLNTYTVKFINSLAGEQIGADQTVAHGSAATAPAVDEYVQNDAAGHYKFTGWDKAFNNVTGDLTVNTVYETEAHSGGTAKCNEYAKCDLCGAEYGDYADHEYGEWIQQINKTCLEDGTLGHYTCSVCGKYFDAEHNELVSLTIAHEGHKPVRTAPKASTCTEKGNIEYYTCGDCGKIFTEEACEHEITAEQTVLDYDYTNHSTDERVTKNAKEAKCNEDGYTGDIYCAACDHEVTHGSVIPMETIAHTPVKTDSKASTCTEKGNIEYYTCSVCGKIFTEETCENEIAAEDTILDFDYTNHSTDERVTKNAKDAKCNEDGYTGDIYCAACDHEVTHGSVIPKETIAHTPVKADSKAATCTEKGNIEYYTCEICGKIFTEEACENEITAEDTVLDFDYTNHSSTETVTKGAKAATCNEDGYTGDIYCAACDHLIEAGEAIPSGGTEHVFGEWYVKTAPTCTEEGVEARVCGNCGEEETSPIAATGHSFGEWIDDADNAPSCTKDGKQHRICARCGETETREVTASEKGHSIRLPNDEGEGYCTFCGEYRCLFCVKDEHMHETNDASVMTFFVHIVHIFYHMFSNFRYTLSHR
ncbi:MAG: InlB B-repeat-containing protein [Clostridia bacterium]|nr:InlB B-repeat-containing protein [Clostridia bacterium]